MKMSVRYFDNAATTRYKSSKVIEEINYYLNNVGVSPGRSHSRLTKECEMKIRETRDLIAELFCFEYPNNVIFTSGATEGLNLIIKGVLKKGDHVIATCVDHNSVLRPIMMLKDSGVENTVVSNFMSVDNLAQKIESAIQVNTKLIVINHASNVTGEVLPVEKIVEVAKKHSVLTLLDCSQTAIEREINMKKLQVDFAVMSGHKSLMGPTGIGFVLINNNSVEVVPLKMGGTGLNSEVLEPLNIKPNAYEAGTLNSMGIYGLNGALQYAKTEEYKEKDIERQENYTYLIQELEKIDTVKIHRLGISEEFVPVVSITIEQQANTDVENYLESKFNIITRSGLHCAPLMHKALGTSDFGTVRISLGIDNTREDIDILLEAIRNIKEKKSVKKIKILDTPTFDNLEEHCLFCNPEIHGQAKQVILKTPHFYLFSPLGAIIDGYLIITPYSCNGENSSISEINKDYIDEFNEIRKIVIDFYIHRYGHPGIAFEHGRAGTCLICKHGTKHCYHGHLCCYPGLEDNDLGLPYSNNYFLWEDIPDSFKKVETNGINDLQERTQYLPYLYIEHYYKENRQYKRKSVAVLINNEEKLESQYLRKLLAKRVDRYDMWDWKKWPQYESACKVLEAFKEWFSNNRKNYNLKVDD